MKTCKTKAKAKMPSKKMMQKVENSKADKKADLALAKKMSTSKQSKKKK